VLLGAVAAGTVPGCIAAVADIAGA